jgi:MoaA/NifB/PqqE/SkfB family radical SAM enzyme
VTYIDPHGKVLSHLGRLEAWQRGEKPAPVTIEWDLSNRCTYGCQDCHFAYTHSKGPWTRQPRMLPMLHDRAGDLADPLLVLRALKEVSAAGVKAVVWTGGGEPTTHPDWPSTIDTALDFGLSQGMYTLGALLVRDTAMFLANRVDWVVVSLDAADAATYAAEKRTVPDNFEKACNAIREMAGHKATVGVSFLLHEANWREAAYRMLPLARSLGASYTTFRPTIRTHPVHQSQAIGDRTWVTDALPWLEALATEPDVEVDPGRFIQWRDWSSHPYRTCYGIRLNTTITPDGRVWVCPNRREFAGPSCLGDLRKESFTKLWARHPGQWTDFADCRVMCRLNPVNEHLSAIYQERAHAEFI